MEALRSAVAAGLFKHATPRVGAPAVWEMHCDIQTEAKAIEVTMPTEGASVNLTPFISDLVSRVHNTTEHSVTLMYAQAGSLLIGFTHRTNHVNGRNKAQKRKAPDSNTNETSMIKKLRIAPSVSVLGITPEEAVEKYAGHTFGDIANEVHTSIVDIRKDETPIAAMFRKQITHDQLMIECKGLDVLTLHDMNRFSAKVKLAVTKAETLQNKLSYKVFLNFVDTASVGIRVLIEQVQSIEPDCSGFISIIPPNTTAVVSATL
jgi:hypothetical protein